MTDTEIKIKGYNILRKEMGEANAEKFVALLLKEPLDYTEWRKALFNNVSVKELSSDAMSFRKK